MAFTRSISLGQLLANNAAITNEQLDEAIREHDKDSKKSIISVLIDKGYVAEQTISDILESNYKVAYISLKDFVIPEELTSLLSVDQVIKLQAIPIDRNNNTLTIGMVNPNDLIAVDYIRFIARGMTLQPVVITEDDFNGVIERLINRKTESDVVEETDEEDLAGDDVLGASLRDLDMEFVNEEVDENVIDPTRLINEAPIVRITKHILMNAIAKGASDIHIQPQAKEILLRYRVDGNLVTEQKIPNRIKLALISRFKIMAHLNIAEKRLPQDGRIRIRDKVKGDIDFRVSTLPSKYGEKIVMRILDRSNTKMGLDRLFPFPQTLALVRDLVDQPYGIIYVTGPTGSGKTTTLYSALSELNKPEYNIVTAEDPIEYEIDGITQVQIDHKIGKDFATVLRSFLRQDPDIILIGETRDKETALIGIEAALTGHMVFTSLHTNDAPGAVTRLIQMGIDDFLIASSIIAVFAQRLVRSICPNCREEYEPPQTIIKYFGLENDPQNPLKFYKGKGCETCKMSGYKGRIGVYEILVANDEIRELITQGATTLMIRHAAQKSGMLSLKEYAMKLVQGGHTTLDEVRSHVLVHEEKEEEEELFCPHCDNTVDKSYIICPHCRYQLKHTCKGCSQVIGKGWVVCPHCGTDVEG